MTVESMTSPMSCSQEQATPIPSASQPEMLKDDCYTEVELLKNEGNEHFKRGSGLDLEKAYSCYMKALRRLRDDKTDAFLDASRWQDMSEDHRQARQLGSALLANIAAVLMSQKEFVASVDCCKDALRLHPFNVKACWRAAKSSMRLELFRQAAEFCDLALAVEPENEDFLKAREVAVQRWSKVHKANESPSSSSLSPSAMEGGVSSEPIRLTQEEIDEVDLPTREEIASLQRESDALADQMDSLRRQYSQSITSANTARIVMSEVERTSRHPIPSQSSDPPESSSSPEENDRRFFIRMGRAWLRQSRSSIVAATQEETNNLSSAVLPNLTKRIEELQRRKTQGDRKMALINAKVMQSQRALPAS